MTTGQWAALVFGCGWCACGLAVAVAVRVRIRQPLDLVDWFLIAAMWWSGLVVLWVQEAVEKRRRAQAEDSG